MDTDVHRCATCGLPDGPDYGDDPHECPPGFTTRPKRREVNCGGCGLPRSECGCPAYTSPSSKNW